jgi:hypothetical protein
MMIMRPATLALFASAFGLLASCASLNGTARDEFAKATTCPPERVTVVPRPDYRMPLPPDAPPPADIAADPGRLAYWQQQRDTQRHHLQNPDCEMFEATGCGQSLMLCCEHPTGDQGEVLMSSASCMGEALLRSALLGAKAPNDGRWGFGLVGGTRVDEVRPGSPADKAGLVPGDVILEVDHQAVGDSAVAGLHIVALMQSEGASSHSLRVQRGTQTLDLAVDARPSASPAPSPPPTAR